MLISWFEILLKYLFIFFELEDILFKNKKIIYIQTMKANIVNIVIKMLLKRKTPKINNWLINAKNFSSRKDLSKYLENKIKKVYSSSLSKKLNK